MQARSGSWLFDAAVDPIAAPETLTEEHRLIGRTAAEFVTNEVVPAVSGLESKDWPLARRLLRRCGELGLLGVDVPEAYGGVDLDKISSVLVSEQLGRAPSFGATFGAQTNLSIVPLLLFGSDEQKSRYLPGLVSGDIVGAYALSEAGAGSDALSARTLARTAGDGSYTLSGEKLWITNGGFADLFIVFAKVDGQHFTAFVVERAFGGVTSGGEEHKMGLHGSSTTPLLLSDVPVTADAVLGEVGKGHRVAFSVLNFGRFKLGAMCTGGCRQAIGEAARHAAGRRQFDRPIASFGSIQHKIGEMTARTYALESVLYRTAGLIDGWLAARDGEGSALGAALEDVAIEASIAKVFGTETLDFVVDENVQIHGGNGFVRDYPAEGHYRDARVNRIFEGTNEINRLLLAGRFLKLSVKGELPLLERAQQLRTELIGPSVFAGDRQAALDDERQAVAAFRKVAIMIAGLALERYGRGIEEQQEVLLWLADILIESFAADSAVRRAAQAVATGHPAGPLHEDAACAFVSGAAYRVESAARETLAAMAEGDALRTQLAALRRLLKLAPANTVVRRRRLAADATARGRYPFE
jgi:alkylation response protein AidB-like acyl-CoA dehydrogenase